MLIKILFLLVSYLAGTAATLAGFGISTILIPVAVLFTDIKTAIVLVGAFHLFNNAFKVKEFYKDTDLWTAFFFGVPGVLFSFAGAMAVSFLPSLTLKKIVAVILMMFALYAAFNAEFDLSRTKAKVLAGGALSGLIAGLTGIGGALRSAFLIAFGLSRRTYIATSAVIALAVDLTRVPAYLFSGIVRDTSYYVLLPFLILTAYLGVRTGKRFIGRIERKRFRRIVLGAVFLAAIRMLF